MTQKPQAQQPPKGSTSSHSPDEDRRDANEQSGSTGRNPGTGDQRDGKNTGQDQYGMTANEDRPPKPGKDDGSSGTSQYGRSKDSNPGSGRAERDESEKRATPQSGATPAKNDESMNPRMRPDKHRNDNENPG